MMTSGSSTGSSTGSSGWLLVWRNTVVIVGLLGIISTVRGVSGSSSDLQANFEYKDVMGGYYSDNKVDYSDSKVIRCSTSGGGDALDKDTEFETLLSHIDKKHSLEYIELKNTDYSESIKEEVFDVWTRNRRFVDIRVGREFPVPESCEVVIENVQELIDSQNSVSCYTENTDETEDTEDTEDTVTALVKDPLFDTYQDLEAIYQWMEMIGEKFPTLVTVEHVGQTFEGREMKALHISSRTSNESEKKTKKKTIVITGGVHAREWVSVSSVLYIANELLNRYGVFKRETKFLENLDFFVIPVFNPDGYSYTWTHDRLWRKNRQQTYFPRCFGIDIDHSFDFKWSGTTNFPCSEDYSGESAFEALEAESWNNYLTSKTGKAVKLHGYLDFHSYSQEVLYPYAYSCEALPRDLENLLELSYGLAKAIRNKSGKKYEVLSSCHDRGSDLTPGLGAGSALDYMYHHRAYWAFQLKLRDTGNHGFLLPAKFIRPVGKESYAAVKYFCDFILNPEL